MSIDLVLLHAHSRALYWRSPMTSREEIEALTNGYLNAFKDKDAQACADIYTDDAIYIACGSQPIRGRSAAETGQFWSEQKPRRSGISDKHQPIIIQSRKSSQLTPLARLDRLLFLRSVPVLRHRYNTTCAQRCHQVPAQSIL